MLKIGEIPYIGKLIQKFLTISVSADYAVKVVLERAINLIGISHQETICDRRILSTTPLAASATWTSDTISVVKYKTIAVHVFTDQDANLIIYQSDDGSTWYRIYATAYVGGSTISPIVLNPTMQFVQVKVENTSANDETILSVSIALQP